jgi:uncharacterized protein (DUF952 family)
MRTEYRDAVEGKNAGITYHLAIKDEWELQKNGETYVPGTFDADGFIHCTDGLDLLTEIANLFYKDSPEARTVLVLAVDRIDSDVRYDDSEEQFPHIYGPLNPSAVIGELPVNRDNRGTFVRLGSA